MLIIVFYVLLVLCLITFDCLYYRFFPGKAPFVYKLCTLAAPLLLFAADMLTGMARTAMACVPADLIVGTALAAFHPDPKYPAWLSLAFSGGLLAAALAVTLLYLASPSAAVTLKTECLPLGTAMSVLVYQGVRFRLKCRKVTPLFSNDEVWLNMMWISGALYVGLMDLSVIVLGFADGESMGLYCSSALSMVATGSLYVRKSSGKTLVLTPAKERAIKVIVKGSLRSADMEGGFDDRKMGALYRRVMSFMNEQQPYLDSSVDLEFFARKLFTNRVYLSRTINVFSGRNFRQFINWHRIEYSLSLMKKDPHLRLEEVSQMSGFNSTVSFNMSFKMFKGMTPREWLDTYREAVGI